MWATIDKSDKSKIDRSLVTPELLLNLDKLKRWDCIAKHESKGIGKICQMSCGAVTIVQTERQKFSLESRNLGES